MIKSHLCCALAALLCLGAAPTLVSGQETTSAATLAPPSPLPPHGADRRMSLDVVVTDASGKPVAGLQQQDFVIIDNKQPQKLLSFHAATRSPMNGVASGALQSDPPVEIILVLDTFNAGTVDIARERTGIENFLSQNGGHLPMPVSLAIFSGLGVTMTSHPTLSGPALIAYLNQAKINIRTIPNDGGFYGALEHDNTSLKALRAITATDAARRPGRKLLIWIGRGWPIIASPVIMQQMTRKQEDAAFQAVVVTSNALRQARMTLYTADSITIGDVGSDALFKAYLKAATSGKDAVFPDLALQVITTQTGGQVIDSITELVDELNLCIADANAFYVLSFDAPPAAHPDEYHELAVRLEKSGLTARTLTGYYSQP